MLATRRPSPVTMRNGTTTLNAFNRLLDDVFSAPGMLSVDSAWVPAIDVVEDKHEIKVIAEIPGVSLENVFVSFEDQVLTIRGEREPEQADNADRVHRHERRYGSFERSLTMPNTVDTDKIHAAYDAGVLTVTLPKVERARPREIPVSTV